MRKVVSVTTYLASIGRKGGLRSRRSLDPGTARKMVALREARRAYLHYHDHCFWSYDHDAVIQASDIPWIIEGLKKEGDRHAYEWARRITNLLNNVTDSSLRFFPVEADVELGYRLNFWDAATNKVLAAAGRAEIRDYLDLLELNRHHLPLGSLIWAAAGKDEGLSPSFIVEELSRVQRYPAEAYQKLLLEKPADPAALKKEWLSALENARTLFDTVLKNAPLGCLFLDIGGKPAHPTVEILPHLTPHFGSIRGCLPRIARPD